MNLTKKQLTSRQVHGPEQEPDAAPAPTAGTGEPGSAPSSAETPALVTADNRRRWHEGLARQVFDVAIRNPVFIEIWHDLIEAEQKKLDRVAAMFPRNAGPTPEPKAEQ